MADNFHPFGIVHNGETDYYLAEEPAEIDCGVYEAKAIDSSGNTVNIELEGWDDGDYDLDIPLNISYIERKF